MKWAAFTAVLFCLGSAMEAKAFEAHFLLAGTSELENPHDVKLSPDAKRLFVSDVGNDRVVVLDAESLQEISAFGSDHQKGTHDLDFDANGLLYVADTHNHRIAIYGFDGLVGKLRDEVRGGFRKPEGVLVGDGGRLYVTGAGSGNIVLFKNGEMVAEAGGLSAPHDVEFAPNGDLWVADAGHDRLLRLDPDFGIKEVLAGAPYDFKGPRYLDVAPDGTLIIADKYTHTVKVVSEKGQLLGVIGDGSPGKGSDKFRTPEGVELKDDILWVADSGNNRIVKYRLSWN